MQSRAKYYIAFHSSAIKCRAVNCPEEHCRAEQCRAMQNGERSIASCCSAVQIIYNAMQGRVALYFVAVQCIAWRGVIVHCSSGICSSVQRSVVKSTALHCRADQSREKNRVALQIEHRTVQCSKAQRSEVRYNPKLSREGHCIALL